MNNFIQYFFTSSVLVSILTSASLFGDLAKDIKKLLASGQTDQMICQKIGARGFALDELAPATKAKITQKCEAYFLDANGTESFDDGVRDNKINPDAWYATTRLSEYRTVVTPITQKKISARDHMLQSAQQRREMLQRMQPQMLQ